MIVTPVAVTATFEQAPSFIRQRHRIIAGAGDANRLDEPLLTPVPEIAGTWIAWMIMVALKIATGDTRNAPIMFDEQRKKVLLFDRCK